MCFWRGLYFVLTNVLVIPSDFIKMFHLQQSRYLRFSMVQQSLSRLQRIRSRWFLLFSKEKVPFLLIYLLPTHKKCNHKKNHNYLNLVYSICHRVDIYRLVKLLTFSFCYLLLFLVSYLPSTTTLRFPHSSSMNISLGKSIKFLCQFHLLLPQL